ncbi:MAG: Crp/Fnr family transcriptional regulator [Bacteroidetes bacterium]|nr:Crp/Fnr family transcriptional regulator [Bacteroidota bacterium]
MKILPESRAEEFVRIGKVKTILTSDYFVKAGEVPYKVAFISSGLFRYVYVNDRGDEFTKGIISEHHFLSSYSAMIQQKPSFFSIEALEDSEILEVNWSSIQQLMEKDVFWVRFLLSFVEMGFMIKEKRERDLLLLDAETRYENFLGEFPGMDQRVKQVIVASYLGIKPETLSRIRKKISS